MKKIISLLFTLLIFFASQPALAQDAEMADGMRADGKIYVVVAIILIVLAGLIAYLFMMDKKLTKLEKQLSNSSKPKVN